MAQKKNGRNKGLSIRTKLIGIIIPIVLIIIFSFFGLSSKMVGEVQVYQNTIEEGNFADDAEILKYMETTVDKNEAYPVGLYMGDDSGIYLDGSGWVPGDDWVLVERDWYVDGKDNMELAFGEPYYDSMTGQVCVSASVRVDYDKAVRVLATDVYLDYVSGVVGDISSEDEMDAFLVTKGSQTIIAHHDAEMMDVCRCWRSTCTG